MTKEIEEKIYERLLLMAQKYEQKDYLALDAYCKKVGNAESFGKHVILRQDDELNCLLDFLLDANCTLKVKTRDILNLMDYSCEVGNLYAFSRFEKAMRKRTNNTLENHFYINAIVCAYKKHFHILDYMIEQGCSEKALSELNDNNINKYLTYKKLQAETKSDKEEKKSKI